MQASGRTRKTTFPSKRPILYYITDRKQLRGRPLLPVIRRALAGGVDFIQIREKDLADGELFDLTTRVVKLARDSDTKVLVNGRADIAIAAGAHGVHLPSSGIDVSDLRHWLPKKLLVGVSVHSITEGRSAATQGVDYLLLGPIFETPSKIGLGPPLGLKYLGRACRSISIPVVALGGINRERLAAVLEAGAAGVAGIRLFQESHRS